MHLFDANAAQSNWEEKYVYSAGKGVKNGAWCCWSRRCVGRRLTDFSSIASCPILCTKRSSFRDMLLISLQGRRILLRLFSGQILSQHLGRWNWQRSGASPKIISRERSTPVCCPNYKTNSKGAFFWENPKNGFVISCRSYGFFTTQKKRKIRKRIIYHDNGMSSYSSWEKNKQTDLHSEDKKKEEHELWMNIRNWYILVWNTNVSRIEHTS